MSRIVVATRKGLFFVDRAPTGWSVTRTAFLGEPVSEAVIGGRRGSAHHPSGVPDASAPALETERGRPSPPRSPLRRPWK